MDTFSQWVASIVIVAASGFLAHGQQTNEGTQPDQQPAGQAPSPADKAVQHNGQDIDPERLAKRDGLLKEAQQLHTEGKLAEAIAKGDEALSLERNLFGQDHDEVVSSLQRMAAWHEECGNFGAAKRALQEVLEIRTRRLGQDHWQAADARRVLSDFELTLKLTPEQGRRLAEADEALRTMMQLYEQGKFADAVPWGQKALEVRREILGEKHFRTATVLNNLAALYRAQGDYARALPLHEQALASYKEVLGEKHPYTATSLNNMAGLYLAEGDYARAQPLLEQALSITRQVLGEKHPDYAQSLSNLATLYEAEGDYARALPLFKKALAICKEVLGEKHAYTATSLHNLATLYQDQGDNAQALPLFEQALSIEKEILGEKHLSYAGSLNNLALLYREQGNYVRALSLEERALAIHKEVLGDKHPDTATILNNLAALHQAKGDYARALPLQERALAIHQEVLGEKHPSTASCLNNLAGLYQDQGDYMRALPLQEQTLAIYKEVLGDKHPETATGLNNLAELYQTQRDYARALPLQEQALEIMSAHIELTAAVQSERQQLAMAERNQDFLRNFVSCVLQTGAGAGDLYSQVLYWKGAVLARQRWTRQRTNADEPEEIGKLRDELQTVAVRLATLALATPQPEQIAAWRRQLAELTHSKENLEAELSAHSAEFRRLLAEKELTPDQLRATLPTGTALVDLLEYSRLFVEPQLQGPPKRQAKRRLAAFVLRADRPVVVVDLGPIEPINEAITTWREQIGEFPGALDRTGQVLRGLVWEPLEGHLEGCPTVLISPDGALAWMPWGALPGSRPDTYLLEARAVAVLPVPQLIPKPLKIKPDDMNEPSLLVIGAVDFGASPGRTMLAGNSRSAPRGANGRDGPRGSWSPLSATRPEIAGIEASFRRAFPPAEVDELRADKATEEAFRQQAGKHRFLHLATHGFFAPPEVRSALAPDKTRDGALDHSDLFGERGVIGFHPGLLSGIVLAGANLPPDPEKDDGILTALEVGALDLRNVDLVTLSACETGLGQVAGGEGILGLQRAFQIAGARTTVASLWKVDDDATRALMTEFYRNLWEKKLPRIEALRQAQLTMLREYNHKTGKLRGPGGIVDIDPDDLARNVKEDAETAGQRTPPFYWAAFVLSGDWQ